MQSEGSAIRLSLIAMAPQLGASLDSGYADKGGRVTGLVVLMKYL